MSKPVLTFPKAVADFVRAEYAAASSILEYGSGGSTVLAAELGSKTIVSVESDSAWLEGVCAYIRSTETTTRFIPVHVDIGPTKEWGHPRTDARWRSFPDYSFVPWQRVHEEDLQPELVLIDGRFRAACFVAAALRTKRPVRVLFDVYSERPYYHWVENYIKPSRLVGRMAVFQVEAGAPAFDILETAKAMYDAR